MYKWWAYRHVSGTIHVKRYYFKEDLEEANESNFVEKCTEVFEAATKEQATVIAQEQLAYKKEQEDTSVF